MDERVWRHSSASINGNCVELARDGRDVLVRDSKAPGGGVLRFSAEDWGLFVRSLQAPGDQADRGR